jgi:transcriptional regulator with XRE-family HTH domain
MEKTQHTSEYKKLTAALRKAREAARLTQAEVAEELGVYASFVSKVESGERRVDVIELKRFCRVYGIELVDFLRSARLCE